MNTEQESRYFQELTLNLQHKGLTVKPETGDGLLPVELDGQPLCLVTGTGVVRYRQEEVDGETRSAALDKVIDTVGVTSRVHEADDGGTHLKGQRVG